MMNAFIFVSVLCMGQTCHFITSTDTMTQKECESIKKEFLTTKYDKKITLAVAQCMQFNEPGAQV